MNTPLPHLTPEAKELLTHMARRHPLPTRFLQAPPALSRLVRMELVAQVVHDPRSIYPYYIPKPRGLLVADAIKKNTPRKQPEQTYSRTCSKCKTHYEDADGNFYRYTRNKFMSVCKTCYKGAQKTREEARRAAKTHPQEN